MKKFLRQIKRFLNQKLGTISDELFWRFRHFSQKDWALSYISEASLNQPHRKLLMDCIAQFEPFESILEVGCASGPNLYLLSQKYRQVNLCGIDISRSAIKTGQKWFKQKGVVSVRLIPGQAYDLKRFKDKNFDVVFSDASLIYLDPKKVKLAVSEMLRLARKEIVLCEFHTDQPGYVYDDHWIHNWRELFEAYVPPGSIKLTRLPREMFGTDNWAKYGHLIEVKL